MKSLHYLFLFVLVGLYSPIFAIGQTTKADIQKSIFPYVSNKSIFKENNEYLTPNAAFMPGNLVVCRVGDGTAPLGNSSTRVFLDEYTTAGVFIQSIAMPTTISGLNQRLTVSGNATSECQINRSADGRYILIMGYNAPQGIVSIQSSNTSGGSAVLRVIGRVDSNGNIDTSTTTTSFSGTNPRSAVSDNGTNVWMIGGNSGVIYTQFGGSGAGVAISTTPTSLQTVNIYNGQLYVSSMTGSVRLGSVGIGLPTTTGQTTTTLPGLPTSSVMFNSFFFADLDSNVAGVDTLYVADGNGFIRKYALVSGLWTAKGTIVLTNPLGLTGVVNGSNVTLYVTNPGSLQMLTDTSGYNANINGSLSLLTAPESLTAFRGVALAPSSPQAAFQFSSATYSAAEGNSVTLTVTRTGSADTAVSVNYAASGGNAVAGSCSTVGNDYQPASGTLNFNAGETQASFNVVLCTDSLSENPAETFTVSLSSPVNGTLGVMSTTSVKILDAASEFTNTTPITISNGTVSDPYPAAINVSGYSGPVFGARVTLYGLSHSNPDDLNVLLVAPGGQSFVLMSDTGGSSALSNATITLEDAALVSLPDISAITDGLNYKPASCGSAAFSTPAPAGPYNNPGCGGGSNPTLASTFGGLNPNGTWNLYVMDDAGAFSPQGSGQIARGWGIQFLTPTAATVSVSGRVMTTSGAGIRNAIITVTGSNLVVQQTVQTGQFGTYFMNGLTAGQSYIISVSTKRYRIAQPVRIVTALDDLADVNFVAEP